MSRRTSEEELTAQLIQSERMAALGSLVAGVAHEINTPMGAIHSNNDIMARAVAKVRSLLRAVPDEELHGLLEILGQVCRNNEIATERITKLVRSLRTFARTDEAERGRVNIHEGIESTLTILQHQLRGRIRIVTRFGDIPKIACFPNQLNQVFMNILVNAAQAIKDRGQITVRTWMDGSHVKVSISDTGRGIERDHLPKLFEPGFTTKAASVGTGLGLSISYKIIRNHQGRIEVETSKQGTKFTITLPTGV